MTLGGLACANVAAQGYGIGTLVAFSGEVDDPDMEEILRSCEDGRVAARELIHAAHMGGAKDNVTVILAKVPPGA